jgi:hypothetical protein
MSLWIADVQMILQNAMESSGFHINLAEKSMILLFSISFSKFANNFKDNLQWQSERLALNWLTSHKELDEVGTLRLSYNLQH